MIKRAEALASSLREGWREGGGEGRAGDALMICGGREGGREGGRVSKGVEEARE